MGLDTHEWMICDLNKPPRIGEVCYLTESGAVTKSPTVDPLTESGAVTKSPTVDPLTESGAVTKSPAFGPDMKIDEMPVLTNVQKQIKEACDKLAENAKNWASGSHKYLFNSSRFNFFSSPEARHRVLLDYELNHDELNEQKVTILLILLRAQRISTNTQIAIDTVCVNIAEMLIEKNRAYGNSALDPIRKFSKASPDEQIRVRIDDKLSRLARGQSAGEDVEKDLIGYLVLLQIARNGVDL